MLRGILRPRREKQLRIMRNEETDNFCFTPDSVKIIK